MGEPGAGRRAQRSLPPLRRELGSHLVELWALDEVGHGLTDGELGHFSPLDDLVANAGHLTALAREAASGLPLAAGWHSVGSLVAVLAALDDPAAYVERRAAVAVALAGRCGRYRRLQEAPGSR